jgi:Ca2+-binding RTX toxin-like protein
LVPFTSFCEYEDTKPRKTLTWFALPEERPLAAFAGNWRPLANGALRACVDRRTRRRRVTTGFTLAAGSSIEAMVADGSASLTLMGNEVAQFLTGNAGRNNLYGLDGKDVQKGGAGNDRLYGGLLADTVTSGAGRDVFAFDTKANTKTNVDRIVDFRSVDDVFWLDNAAFIKIGSNGKLKADAFHLGKRAADREDRIVYDKATGALFYDADGTGASAQIKVATLTNKATIVLSDFQVI